MSASRFPLLLLSFISPLLTAEDMLPAYERAVKHLPAQAATGGMFDAHRRIFWGQRVHRVAAMARLLIRRPRPKSSTLDHSLMR
jgi:hypothetical protein